MAGNLRYASSKMSLSCLQFSKSKNDNKVDSRVQNESDFRLEKSEKTWLRFCLEWKDQKRMSKIEQKSD